MSRLITLVPLEGFELRFKPCNRAELALNPRKLRVLR
jgi:hypothetical protein